MALQKAAHTGDVQVVVVVVAQEHEVQGRQAPVLYLEGRPGYSPAVHSFEISVL